jgi:hypothetical protein
MSKSKNKQHGILQVWLMIKNFMLFQQCVLVVGPVGILTDFEINQLSRNTVVQMHLGSDVRSSEK